MRKKSTKQKVVLIIFGLLLSVVLLELGLRIGGIVFLSLQEHRNRISIRQKGTYRIICLGESTTGIGGKDSYPLQLEEILNQRDIGIRFSVINKGVSGINTAGIVSRLEDNLDRYTPDMVITMMGINDGFNSLVYGDIDTGRITTFLKSFRTYRLIRLLQLHIINKAMEIGIYKLREKKENNTTMTNDFTRSFNFQEQEEALKKIIEENPENDWTYTELAWRYFINGDNDEAEKIFKKVIEENPDDCWANIGLGWRYFDQREYYEAERVVKKAIEINPNENLAYLVLAWCYKKQGKYDNAGAMFKKAIEINPDDYFTYLGLGWCYEKEGKYNKAEEMFKKAIEICPENNWTYIKLAWCYRIQEEYDKAEEILKKAVEIIPENDRLLNLLAKLYEEQGKNRAAEEYFKKASKSRLEIYNATTRHNYQRLKEILTKKGTKLVCVQYPMCSIELLKKTFKNEEGIIFVDNEMVFKKALKRAGYDEYFEDRFAGNFGHCTPKGNKLLAENIADVILKEYFDKLF